LERAVPLQDGEAGRSKSTAADHIGLRRDGWKRRVVHCCRATAVLIAETRPEEFMDSIELGRERVAHFHKLDECGVGVGTAFEQFVLSTSELDAVSADCALSKRCEISPRGDWP
jgi:hypothetical protein